MSTFRELMLFYVLLFRLYILNVSSQSIILGACKDDEFECDDGVCIPKSWQCDYEIDCANREDERHDINGNDCIPCEDRGYFCENDPTLKCIPPQWRCDGWSDCPNSDDENFCVPCTEHQFQCNDGKCIDIEQLCNFNNDCYGGEDEINDIHGDNCPVCPFRCDNNICITQDKLCDGNFDCNDRTDECDINICSTNQPDACIEPITPLNTTTNVPFDISNFNTETHDSNIDNNGLPFSDIRDWKYCPSDIVWLGFVHSNYNDNENTTAVYWIPPKIRGEGLNGDYIKYSTSYNSGHHFSVGIHTVEYIGKKKIINNTNIDSENRDIDDTDDPIFCHLTILVLDGMRDYEIAACEAQNQNDYIEWDFVVDDNNYEIAYFNIGEYEPDIERARFVPENHKFHTDCYAKIAFETGIISNDEEIIIEETVTWIASHLYAFIGLMVGIILLFIILLIIIIILWRKHVEMKEFIRADTYDKDEIGSSEDDSYSENINILDTKQSQRAPSTINLDITTPGGVGYNMSRNNSINQIPYITSSHSSNNMYSNRSIGYKTQFEYNLNHLNNNINNMKKKG
eukprot:256841_1